MKVPLVEVCAEHRRLLARQVSRRGGDLVCEDRGDRVIISGPAVLVFEGTLTIDRP